MKENYSNLIYFENEENIGIDGNMRKAFEMGIEAQWCLMLGDDDEVKYGAFSILFEAIDLYEDVAFILVNWLTSKGVANKWEDYKLYEDAVECFQENHDKTPYGTIIYNMECSKTVSEEEKNRFMGTYHLYSGMLWDMALRKKKVLRIGVPCIFRGEEEKTYESYIDDVLWRGIPEWYVKLAEPYQNSAKRIEQNKRMHLNEMSKKHLALFLMMNRWVKIKQEGKSLANYFETKGYKKIAIYGMSYVGRTLLNELKGTEIQIIYGIDKRAEVGINADINIVSPEDMLESVDAIVVTAITFYDAIKKKLSKKVCCPVISLKDVLSEV